MDSESEILRTDLRGRIQYTKERREGLLNEYDRSGLSGPKFAAVSGIKYQTLAGWLIRRRRAGASAAPNELVQPKVSATGPVQWLEAVIERPRPSVASAAAPSVVVRLPSGATLECSSEKQATIAAVLLRAWEKASC
jgi:hypothetical protein